MQLSEDKNSLRIRLESIRKKLEILLEDHNRIKAEKTGLESEIKRLKNITEIQKNTIKDLEERNKLAKIAKVILSDSEDSKTLKLRINEYIRDIDKCIRMLNE